MKKKAKNKVAEKLVKKTIVLFESRNGFGNWWSGIYPEIKEDIKEELHAEYVNILKDYK